MSTLSSLRSILALSLMSAVACADGGESDLGGSGGKGAGGSPTSGGASAQGGTASGGASQQGGNGGEASVCGDGLISGAEKCEGSDFGGATCESLGLGGGDLQCTSACGISTAQCSLKERCFDNLDNDLDGAWDCADVACADAPECQDSCLIAQHVFVTSTNIGDYEFTGSLYGKPNTTSPSCIGATGSEAIVTFIPPVTGHYLVQVGVLGKPGDLAFSVRTSCADAASELLCVDDPPQWFNNTEVRSFPVTEGEPVFLVVDTHGPSDEAVFKIWLSPLGAEESAADPFLCADGLDDDVDGLTDCDDPGCAGTAECATDGILPFGAACLSNTECAPVGGVALCSFLGNAPYCSRYCDPAAADDCGVGNECYALSESEGVCLQGCVDDSGCDPAFACKDVGLGHPVCQSTERLCADFGDDDQDSMVDCQDPDCAASPDCVPGTAPYGTPCTAPSECFAQAGGTPVCDWATQRCRELCDPTDPSSCAAGAFCFYHPISGPFCYLPCASDAECNGDPNSYCGHTPQGMTIQGGCDLAG